MANLPMFLGVEIGGAKLQAALGDGRGTILQQERVAARPLGGRAGICEQIETLVRELLSRANLSFNALAGAGVGFGGPVDAHRGVALKSHQVAGWDNFPLGDWFRERLGLESAIGNDSDLAGLAEAHFGAGKGFSPVAYMNIGSGIGGALVVDGKSYVGQGVGAFEIGHLRIAPSEPGQPWHTLEDLCSGWALARSAQQASSAGGLLAQMSGGDPTRLTAESLVAAVRKSDPAAVAIWNAVVERLGVAVANVITLTHPQCFVVGGGVGLVGELLFEPLRKQASLQGFAPFAGGTRIVPAALGETVVLHGALKLAADRAKSAANA